MRKVLVLGLFAAATVLASATVAHAAPPSNDDIADAIVVTSVPFTDSVNTSEATGEPTDTFCAIAPVWYRFTPAETGVVEFNTAGSDFDTVLSLNTGDPSSLNLEQCNNDSIYGMQSRIVAQLEAGVTYYLAAGRCCEEGPIGPGGNLVFNVQPAPPPVTAISITVQRAGTATHAGLVTITGTVVCDEPAEAFVSVTLTQRFNRNRAFGGGGASLVCGPASTNWTVQLESSTGTVFGPGNASAEVTAFAFNGTGSVGTELVTVRSHLRSAK